MGPPSLHFPTHPVSCLEVLFSLNLWIRKLRLEEGMGLVGVTEGGTHTQTLLDTELPPQRASGTGNT